MVGETLGDRAVVACDDVRCVVIFCLASFLLLAGYSKCGKSKQPLHSWNAKPVRIRGKRHAGLDGGTGGGGLCAFIRGLRPTPAARA